jgi:hypothetical protein
MVVVSRDRRMPMAEKKKVYLREHGDDKNHGLSSDRPVRTGRRALDVALKEKTEVFDIRGTDAYKARVNAELEKAKGHE